MLRSVVVLRLFTAESPPQPCSSAVCLWISTQRQSCSLLHSFHKFLLTGDGVRRRYLRHSLLLKVGAQFSIHIGIVMIYDEWLCYVPYRCICLLY